MRLHVILAIGAILVCGSPAFAQDSATEPTTGNFRPSDGAVNPDRNDDRTGTNSTVSFFFEATSPGELKLGIREEGSADTQIKDSVTYPTEGERQRIEFPVDTMRQGEGGNLLQGSTLRVVEVMVRFEASESAPQPYVDPATGGTVTDPSTGEVSMTTVTVEWSRTIKAGEIFADGLPPDPIALQADEVQLGLADGALNVAWNPAATYSTSVSAYRDDLENNAEFIRIIWATSPLSDVITVDSDSISQQGNNRFAPIRNYGNAQTLDVPATESDHILDGLENSKTVYLTLQVIDPAGNASDIAVDSANNPLFVSETPITTETLAEILGFDDRCFVVTAAYGDQRAVWVDAWRFFRDGFLLRLPYGQDVVQFYYQNSPPAAAWLADSPTARALARVILTIAAPAAVVLGSMGPLLLLGLLALFPALGWVRRTRHAAVAGLVLSTALIQPATATAGEFIGIAAELEQAFSLQLSQLDPSRVRGVSDNGVAVDYGQVYGGRGTVPIKFSYHLFPVQLLGDWGIHAGTGFALDRGKSINTDGGRIRKSDETIRMVYAPTSAGLSYRGRWFRDQPLMISGQFGIDLWPFMEGNPSGRNTQNFVSGWHGTAELELLLDWMEKSAAQYMLDNYGIKDTAVFAGYQHSRLDDFGNPKTADFTHSSWQAGLRLSF